MALLSEMCQVMLEDRWYKHPHLQVKNRAQEAEKGLAQACPKFTPKLEDATAKTESWVSWMPRLLYLAKLYSSVCTQMMMGQCD